MLLDYIAPPLLVDISDKVIGATTVRRRARRYTLELPDSPDNPCLLRVEVIPYARLANGDYGDELTGGVFRRDNSKVLHVSPFRLVESATGRILASRFLPGGGQLSDADWQAVVDDYRARPEVEAMRQTDWFRRMLREVPAVVDSFIVQYIQLADLSGDLD